MRFSYLPSLFFDNINLHSFVYHYHHVAMMLCKILLRFLLITGVEMLQSFDHGYYLLVKSIQELREKKDGLVTVGIGGPSGSGKTRYTCCVML